MIWLNLKELEKRLINGEVSDKMAFSYLLTHLIFMTVVMEFVSNDGPSWAVMLHLVINLGFTIWGVRETYKINERGGNTEYLKRFLSLSFVVGIRLLLIALVLSVVLGVVALIAKSHYSFFVTTREEAVMEVGLLLVFAVYYYYVLLSSFKRINAVERNESQVGPATN